MFEIEIKSLLGSKERASELKRRLTQLFPALETLPTHKQRNHYFNTPADLTVFEKTVKSLLTANKQQELSDIVKGVRGGVSVRTRDADGAVLVILKASIGSDTSANGVSRIEFEERVNLSLAELDQRLIEAGLTYQAKWSREREEFVAGEVHITIDKNAGYGYLAEFERMVEREADTQQTKQELVTLMRSVGAEELPQDRLERMFSHYNAHWEEYYGTDKVFVIE